MKKLLSLIALAGTLSLGHAQTAAPAPAPAATSAPAQTEIATLDKKAPTAQQSRMKTCNTDAKTQSLKGDARKAFMKSCLSGDTATAPTQQTKMKTCNADAGAKALKGDERKKFMSECLKG